MSDEVKNEIIMAWNRYLSTQRQRQAKNEWSTAQHEETLKMFRKGIANHPKLSKKERQELLVKMGLAPHA
ncbi:MAG: hypothetical protein N3E51_01730 [Candidatus Micrarchaeota archaeon]|nr:hypothetical protein [Candidatus Micrarchaeota archaeon]